jgi:hypothetical protein
MIRHVFLWRVAPTADPAKVLALLSELPEHVPAIRNFALGKFRDDLGSPSFAWDYGLSCEFETIGDLATYMEHPRHQEIIAQLDPMISDRAVCHFDAAGAANQG